MTYYLQNGDNFSVTAKSAINLHETLPAGTYNVGFNPMSGQYFLTRVDDYTVGMKIYGDVLRQTERILNTFESRDDATGVMLAGEQGSGKTLLAKMLSITGQQQGIPTIVVNEPWHGEGFNAFIQTITQKAIIIFDEFEKVYDREQQEKMLTLFDGVYPSKKLFIITCNDKYRVNDHMKNRPGRFFYRLDFTGLEQDFIVEYCQDNLKNQSHIDSVCRIALLFGEFNFDILKAMVEEMNRYDESPQEVLKVLNAKPENSGSESYDTILEVDGKPVSEETLYNARWNGNPLSGKVHIMYRGKEDDEGDWDWETAKFSTEDLKSIDSSTGQFLYQNKKGDKVSLRRVKAVAYDWSQMV